MAAGRLSPQDKKDLEKFTKFFVLKSLQIIVQSRLGEKLESKSKPFSSGADWFNLAIRDIPEVQSEAKKVLSAQPSVLSQDICAEISLRTAEGDTMVLETWNITLRKDACDPSAKVSYTIYNRMGIALKSLISVSRVPPAYRLARHQSGNGAGDYVICYRLYPGDPQVFQLGDAYQSTRVGAIPTPVGTITLNLSYRTKLLISPHRTKKMTPFEVKDDHFKRDNSPRRPTTPKPCSLGFRRNSTSEDLMAAGLDRQDLCSTMFSTSPASDMYIDYPDGSLQNRGGEKSVDPKDDLKPHSIPEKTLDSFVHLHKVAAFSNHRSNLKDTENDFEEIPFLCLLSMNQSTVAPKTPPPIKRVESSTDEKTDPEKAAVDEKMEKLNNNNTVSTDDLLMVPLKAPFAGTDSNTDLVTFYRDCQQAKNLQLFEDECCFHDALNVVTDQLAVFESEMKDFDNFVDLLQTQENSQ